MKIVENSTIVVSCDTFLSYICAFIKFIENNDEPWNGKKERKKNETKKKEKEKKLCVFVYSFIGRLDF